MSEAMMRPDAPPAEVHAGALIVEPVVSSWLGDRQLATAIPVESGTFVKSARTAVPERLTLTVPTRGSDGTDWRPRGADHPLGKYGQFLDVALRITEPVSSRTWLTRLGRCQIQDTERDGGDLVVTAFGRMRRLEDHKIGLPTAPGPRASMASEVRRLISPTGLEVWVHPDLTDRPIRDGITWGSDRLDTILELAKAWPARVRSDETGRVLFLPPLPEDVTPVVTLRDGEGGTVVRTPDRDSREGVYNHVIVRGKDRDKNGHPSFQVERFATVGPFSVRTYGTVTKDPIVLDMADNPVVGRRIADAELVKALVTSRVVPVTHAADYRLDLDVPVEVLTHSDGGVDVHEWGYVIGVQVPLTAADGDMVTHVGVYR